MHSDGFHIISPSICTVRGGVYRPTPTNPTWAFCLPANHRRPVLRSRHGMRSTVNSEPVFFARWTWNSRTVAGRDHAKHADPSDPTVLGRTPQNLDEVDPRWSMTHQRRFELACPTSPSSASSKIPHRRRQCCHRERLYHTLDMLPRRKDPTVGNRRPRPWWALDNSLQNAGRVR